MMCRLFDFILDIELRVATIPTSGGKEDVVLWLLSAGRPVPLVELGLSSRNLELLQSLIVKPYGLFLVCGPTGSGKTTTLHSVLGHINTPDTKIWTAEDPVEITEETLCQVQINPRADMTFARVMRAFLRADPDVIMVGELRDKEAVSIAIEASLTGHRVLATLHTNSAPESIARLLDMDMDPFNFADALLGVMAQRLAKRLCPKCKKPHMGRQDEVKAILAEYTEELRHTHQFKSDSKAAREAIYDEWKKNYAYENGQFILYEPMGCDECRNTGFKGRIGMHELLAATDSIKQHIQEHHRVSSILATAINEGMRTLKQDGIERSCRAIPICNPSERYASSRVWQKRGLKNGRSARFLFGGGAGLCMSRIGCCFHSNQSPLPGRGASSGDAPVAVPWVISRALR